MGGIWLHKLSLLCWTNKWYLDVNIHALEDSLSMLGVCEGGTAVPVEPAVEEGLVPGLEVDVLPA